MNLTKNLMLGAIAFGVLATGNIAFSDAAMAGKEVFQRNKPHVNVSPSIDREPVSPQTLPGTEIKKKHPDLVFKQPYGNGSPTGAPMTGYCGGNQGSGASKDNCHSCKEIMAMRQQDHLKLK